ncbi:5'-AMP-activated protein kinase subunit beta-1 [Cytospora mali]|uniref:5'-AMP-activated protein kinase subunit beta-1 n=1 Tax=Cytospora mali TaxID=578113 RepID=A0A194UUQ4_CYTMA|nr:5'-AMP-activated protein kinase subunit beta-1 [Valsa mali var. pyri (nom. inval.)]
MVAYTFKWSHPAEEVYVTGTFDNWSKSEKMEKVGDTFEKSVDLPDTSEKIYYKFVVDGTWTTNPTDSHEKDEGGNENNVLTPETLLKSLPATVAIMNSVSADSTTAQLAKDVPLERDNKAETETATADATADANSSDLPGTFPETPADELNKTVSVNPLPAAEGGLNPIKLAPGEPIPNDLKTADTNSNVKLDPESYEKSDALPGLNFTDFTVSPITGTMIPESSLPIGSGDLNINTVGADSTTAALAAEVPLEPKVPEVVKESQDKAGVDPEASGIAEEVKEKEQVEEELKEKVPEAPSTSEGTAGQGTDKSEGDKTLLETAAATAAGLGGAAVATAVATKDKAIEATAPIAAENLPDSVKEQLPVPVQETINATAKETTIETVSPEVPAEVKESIVEAGKSPEAAANTEAVEEKKAVEAELLSEVKPTEVAAGEGAKAEPESVNTEPVVSEPVTSEPPKTPVQEAPQVVEPPASAAEIPEVSEPTGNGATNGTTTANGAEAPATPPKDKDAQPADALAPSSPTKSDQKKKNRFSGFFGKLKSKITSK